MTSGKKTTCRTDHSRLDALSATGAQAWGGVCGGSQRRGGGLQFGRTQSRPHVSIYSALDAGHQGDRFTTRRG